MSDEAAQIVVPGPNIIAVSDLTRDGRRAESLRHNAEMAAALATSGGWDWFVAQCEAKANVLAASLIDAGRQIDPRDEDRHRGRIEAYRAMPRVVTDAAAKYAHAVAKANQKQEQRT